NGWAVPQDGQYRARLHCQITTAAGRGGIRAQILIDGALPAQGARTMEGWVGSEQPESLELEARYVLQAGQSLGFRVQRRNGSVSVTEGLGTISFERIA
ncbi:MAG: hypothetical protein H6827_06685, partial [Planctomycetes bacterium]|nr:hypothetical protein [Planctomycetota bacterium]